MNIVEKLIEEMKEELLGKEMTLLELDKEVGSILDTNSSMFDYSVFRNALDENLKSGSYSYSVTEEDEIEVEFDVIEKPEILEDDEDAFDIVVKVTNIWKL